MPTMQIQTPYGSHSNLLYPSLPSSSQQHQQAEGNTSVNIPVSVPPEIANKHRQQYEQLAMLQQRELLHLAMNGSVPGPMQHRVHQQQQEQLLQLQQQQQHQLYQATASSAGQRSGLGLGFRNDDNGSYPEVPSWQDANGTATDGFAQMQEMQDFLVDVKKRKVEPKYDNG